MQKMLAGMVVILSLAGTELAIAQAEPAAQSGARTRISAETKRNDVDSKEKDPNCASQDKTDNDIQGVAQAPENSPCDHRDGNEKKSNCECTGQTNNAAPGDLDAPQNKIEYGGGG